MFLARIATRVPKSTAVRALSSIPVNAVASVLKVRRETFEGCAVVDTSCVTPSPPRLLQSSSLNSQRHVTLQT
jgi:hypothetical protein